MFSTNLENIVFNRHIYCHADELLIITGYIGPAPFSKDGLRHIHPDSQQARSITVREAARLQTFDDDYEFISAAGANYKMIGNAVPPYFSYKLAKAIEQLLSKL